MCPIEKFSTEKWDMLIAVNLSAAFHTSRLALPGMKERGMPYFIVLLAIQRSASPAICV